MILDILTYAVSAFLIASGGYALLRRNYSKRWVAILLRGLGALAVLFGIYLLLQVTCAGGGL